MTRVNPYQPKINAGEFSPEMVARTDFQKYQNAASIFENATPIPEGGFQRRAGTRFIAEVKDSTAITRLRGFEFSTDQAYFIEMGDLYFRFYRNQSPILVDETDAVITNGAFDTDISGWSDESVAPSSISWNSNQYMDLTSNGSTFAIAEQSIAFTNTSQEHVLRFRIIGSPGNNLTVRAGSASGLSDFLDDINLKVGFHSIAFTPTSSPMFIQFQNELDKAVSIDDVSFISNNPVEVTTPYLSTEVFRVEGPQSADVLYMTHKNHPIHTLLRRGDTTWSVVEVDVQDGPYDALNETETTFDPSANTGLGVSLVASSTDGINDGQGFLSTDVGRLIRLDNASPSIDWGYARIVSVTDSLNVIIDVKRNFEGSNANVRWMLGSWSETTGYPANSGLFQQRFVACNTTQKPQTVWFGEVNGFGPTFIKISLDSATPDGKWDETVEDDDGITYNISAENVNAILWLLTSEVLILGTTGGEWVPESEGANLTPFDIDIRRRTTYGSAEVQPTQVGAAAIFLQRAKRKIRNFEFAFQTEGYKAFDMTRLARHITQSGVVEMDYQREPDSIIWFVRNDGQLLAFEFNPDEDVVGWSRCILGGVDAAVKSLSTIPGSDGAGQIASSEERDELGLIVSRTIDGTTKQYVEVMERVYEDDQDQKDAYYCDSLITYDDIPTMIIGGLDHLEGETVQVLGDGAVLPTEIVSGGEITLDSEVSVAQIGLGYKSKYQSLKLDAGAQAGTAVGKIKNIKALTLVILRGHTYNVGISGFPLQERDFREVEDAMDAAVPFFTGEDLSNLAGNWETDPRIIVEVDDPVPFTMLALAAEAKTNEMV